MRSRPGTARASMGDRVGALAASVLLATMLAGCGSGPFLVFPGGAISGERKPDPDSWAFAGDAGTMELETQTDALYSVNIAYTIMDDRLYVNAGDTKTEWVTRMESNPQVRILMGDDIYELRALRVTDPDTIERFGAVWEAQSFFRRNPAELEGEVWIYELETD
jgi:hypothetical protein